MAETRITPIEINNPYKFSAYKSTTTGITGTQVDTIIFNVESFDTNNNYDTSTGVYTAPVAGYYYFTGHVRADSTGATYMQLYVAGDKCNDSTTANGQQNNLIGGKLVYLAAGGAVSCGIYHNGTANIVGSAGEVVFSGFLVCKA